MSIPEREQLIMDALVTMTANHPDLFRKRNHWQGIYLVVRDRLDYGYDDLSVAYYEMENNPQAALCDTFWETLIEVMGNDGEMC